MGTSAVSNHGLVKQFLAGAAVVKHRIVKFSAADTVIQGAAVGDQLIGVADELGADAAADRIDVVMSGIVVCDAGGTIALGDHLTTDSTGQAVAAAPASGVNNSIIGFALKAASDGDLIPVLLAPGQIQG